MHFSHRVRNSVCRSGNGTPVVQEAKIRVETLQENRLSKNKKLVDTLREECRWSDSLMQLCKEDAQKGRMEMPRHAHEANLDQVTLSPRFAVIQGVKPDGSPKVRPVDDLTRSECNAATEVTEKLAYESLDELLASARAIGTHVQKDLALWKADIDSAFRRIPIKPQHRQFAHIVFRCDGSIIVSKHLSLPFGAVASVHHWERIGEFIKTVARRLLHLPVLRYVDDFFAAELAGCEEHSKNIFARLVRCMLGRDSIAGRKLLHGNPLPILGVAVEINLGGITFIPEPDKLEKWRKQIKAALDCGHLCGGEASRLAGRLAFSSQKAFRRIGRAMLQPIYKQITRRSSVIDAELKIVLEWWLQILKEGICEVRQWGVNKSTPVHLLCDARSTPPRVAAVCVIGDSIRYADLEPSRSTLEQFKCRGDNQIASLEMLAIAFGASS